LKRRALALILLVLVAGALGGYAFLRESKGGAQSAYNTSFSEVQSRIVDITRDNCSQNVCSTGIGVSVAFPKNPGTSSLAYYPDLILLSNAGDSPSVIRSISAVNVNGDMSGVSRIDIYYFSSVSEFNVDGTPSGTPPGSCVMTSVLGCTVFKGNEALPGLSQDFIEVVVYTQGGASQGTVGFTILVESN
jgi:hypothetical protein